MYKIQDFVSKLTLQLRLNISNILLTNLCLCVWVCVRKGSSERRLFAFFYLSHLGNFLLLIFRAAHRYVLVHFIENVGGVCVGTDNHELDILATT